MQSTEDGLELPGFSPDCLSQTIFDALISMPGSIAGANDQGVACTLFVFLILFGFGMLFLGACFEKLFSLIAFGTVLWLILFLSMYALVYGEQMFNLANGTEDTKDCDWPFWASLGITLGAMLVLSIISCLCSLMKPVVNFLAGFTLGALGMVVLFFIITNSNPDWVKDAETNTGLEVYIGIGITASVICGILAIFFAPIVGILTRCATGGFVMAVGIVGINNTFADPPLAEWVFWVLFGSLGGAGALLQIFYKKKNPDSGSPGEETPLKK